MKAKNTERKTIRVKVVLSVEVDVDAYELNYGIGDVATIRQDLRAAIGDAIRTGAVLHDGIVDVDVLN